MTGEFEEYEDKKTGKMRYSFKVQEVSEMIPSEEDGIKSYLRTLKGVGPVLAESMFHEFGKDIFKNLFLLTYSRSTKTKSQAFSNKPTDTLSVVFYSILLLK